MLEKKAWSLIASRPSLCPEWEDKVGSNRASKGFHDPIFLCAVGMYCLTWHYFNSEACDSSWNSANLTSLQKMCLGAYGIIFNPPHPMTQMLLMSGPRGLECRNECSLLCSTCLLPPQLPSFSKGSTISVSWRSTKVFCSTFSAVI